MASLKGWPSAFCVCGHHDPGCQIIGIGPAACQAAVNGRKIGVSVFVGKVSERRVVEWAEPGLRLEGLSQCEFAHITELSSCGGGKLPFGSTDSDSEVNVTELES
jgi:hypothetical protein